MIYAESLSQNLRNHWDSLATPALLTSPQSLTIVVQSKGSKYSYAFDLLWFLR